jgi:hypothetical protein
MVAEPLNREERRRLQQLKKRPEMFIRRCHVEDDKNKRRRLNDFWPEQRLWMKALMSSYQVFGLKPRQMGFTTLTCLFFLWKHITAKDPVKSLVIVHEDAAIIRLAKMLKVAVEELPGDIRPKLRTNNQEMTTFARWDAEGKEIDGPQVTRMLAGGSGQGRSWTYNNIHATEMAHWRKATASQPHAEGMLSADEEVFASACSTKHDPKGHVVVESTGNGPQGFFHTLYGRAKSGTDEETGKPWAFVFVPWRSVDRYELDLSEEGQRRIEDSLDAYESNLYRKLGVSLNKIAWRRWKKNEQGLSDLSWRRNYPLTDDDPFVLDESGWFRYEALELQKTYCQKMLTLPAVGDLVQHHPYEAHRSYVIGGDTSGGTGNDEAVFECYRDDLLHVATWASKRASPVEQALACSRLATMYGGTAHSGVLTIIEDNKYGKVVLGHLAKLGGCRLWKGPDKRDWHTDHATKRMLMTNARDIIDHPDTSLIIQDPLTVTQLLAIVEKEEGQIEARSGHDDRAIACCLALWGWLKLELDRPTTGQEERERIATILQLFRIPHG